MFTVGTQIRILVIEHTCLLLCLVDGDPLFDRCIILHGIMPVQVIRRDIQDGAHCRFECICRFQLEGADLAHCDRFRICFGSCRSIGAADVSDDKCAAAKAFFGGRFHDLSHQRGCRGLAVCSCDRYDLSFFKQGPKFNLGDDRRTLLFKFLKEGGIQRHSRAGNDLVKMLISKRTFIVRIAFPG